MNETHNNLDKVFRQIELEKILSILSIKLAYLLRTCDSHVNLLNAWESHTLMANLSLIYLVLTIHNLLTILFLL